MQAFAVRPVERRHQPEHGHRRSDRSVAGRSQAARRRIGPALPAPEPSTDRRPSAAYTVRAAGGGSWRRSMSPSRSSSRTRSVRRFGARPGSAARRSVKRRGPISSSRRINRVQRSPTASSATATGQYWSYDRMIQRYDTRGVDFNCLVEEVYQRDSPHPRARRSPGSASSWSSWTPRSCSWRSPTSRRRSRRSARRRCRGCLSGYTLGLRRPARAGRAPGRPLGTQVDVHRRPGGVHRCVGDLRLRADGDPADRRPRPPGRRRGGRHAGVAGARPAGHAARAGPDRRRHLGVDGRPRRSDRTDDRWAARRLGRLAVGLLRQHPGVRAGRGGGPADARRVEGVRPRPVPGPGRIGAAGCRRRGRLPGARAERRLGVGRPAHDRRPRGRGRARRRLRRPLAPSAGAGPRPLAVPHPELPVGERGDGCVRPLVHGDVPGQRHVPDLGLAVRHRQGRAGDVAGTDRRARCWRGRSGCWPPASGPGR